MYFVLMQSQFFVIKTSSQVIAGTVTVASYSALCQIPPQIPPAALQAYTFPRAP